MRNNSIEPYRENSNNQNFSREEAYLRAKKKLDKIVGFYWHLAIYIAVNTFLVILIGSNTSEGYFSFAAFSTAIFWGIGLLFHFLGVYGPDFLFGKNWEERKIREFMDKDKQSWE